MFNRWTHRPYLVPIITVVFLTLATFWANSLTLANAFFVDVYSIFWALLLFFIAVFAIPKVGYQMTTWLNKLANFLERRGSFVSNPITEAPKFALIRIVFGLFMIERAVWVLIYFFPNDWANTTLVSAAILSLIFSIAVCVGFFTQIAFVFFVFVQWQLTDPIMTTATLGNDVAAMLSILLIVTNAGAHYSIDGLLRRKSNWIGRAISATYYADGLPKTNVIQIAKFLILTSYWCICVYSLMSHLKETSWLDGSAGPLLLTNSYMSRFFSEFQQFFELGTWAVNLGKIALWTMLPWYASILPFVLIGGWFRAYVIIWGLLFFALSTFILQLGWLGEFEFLMWAAIFWQSALISSRKSLHVAYDDKCNLCDRTINLIKFVDVFGRVKLRPVSNNKEWLNNNNIDTNAALQNLYGVEEHSNNRTTYGYDFYITLSRNIFLLLPAFPILIIGKWIGIGPIIYRFIADRRTKLFGVCEIPTTKPESALSTKKYRVGTKIGYKDPFVPFAFHFLTLSIVYLMFLPIPTLKWTGIPVPNSAKSIVQKSTYAAHIYGLTPLDVFNKTDLRLSENWFTLSRIDSNGKLALLPVFRENGSRLGMHKSDRVYYGHTLPFRRHNIGRTGCFFDKYKETFERFARYDSTNNTAAPAGYFYKQFQQLQPDLTQLLEGQYIANDRVNVCTKKFKIAE